jgi:hypothetical protein
VCGVGRRWVGGGGMGKPILGAGPQLRSQTTAGP